MIPAAVLMAVFEEEQLLPGALDSLWAAGFHPEQVYVFDGAWCGGEGGSHTFAGSAGPSRDRTMYIAEEAGCWTYRVSEPWRSQEAKRTFMFTDAPWNDGVTHYLVFDADERLEGTFPHDLPDDHANIMVRCVGPNDMPGIRGEWPNGDYCADYKPELRLFRRAPDLDCVYPGGYWADGGMIQAYANARGDSALPVLEGVSLAHHGNERTPQRKRDKIAYYHEEHPVRHRWQQAIHRTL